MKILFLSISHFKMFSETEKVRDPATMSETIRARTHSVIPPLTPLLPQPHAHSHCIYTKLFSGRSSAQTSGFGYAVKMKKWKCLTTALQMNMRSENSTSVRCIVTFFNLMLTCSVCFAPTLYCTIIFVPSGTSCLISEHGYMNVGW